MNITKWGMVEEEIHYHDLVDLNVFGFNPLKCYYDWSFTFSFILFFFSLLETRSKKYLPCQVLIQYLHGKFNYLNHVFLMLVACHYSIQE